ncbi:MAG: MgtC/SapB family protein [Muribaculaceae bacterium]|nr:MgtC/SapB family protein [Muribaculaceae bacterium]
MDEIARLLDQLYTDINSVGVNTTSSIFKMLLSLVLGSIVGFERKRKGQSAGLRTFALIAMGATLAMLLSIYVPQEYLGLKNGDPGRIAAQVISGIGFLGAGAIIQMKGSVKGLTTAAGIWMVATLGMAVGVGMYLVSIVATLLILFILVQLERIEHKVNMGSESRIIRIKTASIVTDIQPYRSLMRTSKVHVTNIYVEYDYETHITKLNLVVLVKDNVDLIHLFEKIRAINPTLSITLANQVNI